MAGNNKVPSLMHSGQAAVRAHTRCWSSIRSIIGFLLSRPLEAGKNHDEGVGEIFSASAFCSRVDHFKNSSPTCIPGWS